MKRINLIQIGIGLIGGATVDQVLHVHERWKRDYDIDVRYVGLIGSNGGISAPDANGFDAKSLKAILDARRKQLPFTYASAGSGAVAGTGSETFDRAISFGPAIVIDTAAGNGTLQLIKTAIDAGAGMVFSNKSPFALPGGDEIGDLLWRSAGPGGRVRYETTCGAGLPVISTLRTLLDSGDEVREIVGTVSGTLGAIFSDVAAGKPFSEAVRSAKTMGYTEPDPRDDLSGLDVARKALILARTIGRPIDLTEIEIESLVSPGLRNVSVDEFLARCGEMDLDMAQRATEAAANGMTLKYVARVTPDEPVSVGVQPIDRSTVLGALQGPENIVSIRTSRYDTYPLTVTGPGAGAAVTAAGVIGDILALATSRTGG